MVIRSAPPPKNKNAETFRSQRGNWRLRLYNLSVDKGPIANTYKTAASKGGSYRDTLAKHKQSLRRETETAEPKSVFAVEVLSMKPPS